MTNLNVFVVFESILTFSNIIGLLPQVLPIRSMQSHSVSIR